MSTLELFFYLQLPTFKNWLLFVNWMVLVGLVAAGIATLKYSDEHSDHLNPAMLRKKGIRGAVLGLLAVLNFIPISLIPERETVYALAAFEIGRNIEGLAALPDEATELLRSKLREQTEELKRSNETKENPQ